MDIFNGVDLSDEQKEALQANLNSSLEGYVPKTEFESVLKNKNDLLAEKKEEQRKAQEAQAEAEKARLEKAAASGDVESIKKSYEERIAALTGEIDIYNTEKKTNTLSSIARKFVEDNVVDEPFIRKSVTAEIVKRLDVRDGKTVVLSADGGLSSHSVDDLFSEFKTSAEFKPHIVASKASGSGASGGKQAGSNGVDLSEKSLAQCETKEDRVAVIAARRAARK